MRGILFFAGLLFASILGYCQAPVAEVEAVGTAESAAANVPAYVSAEDAPFLGSMSANHRAMAAARRSLWRFAERQRFEPYQQRHAERFPDTPVPLTESELSAAQREELEQLNKGISYVSAFVPPSDPEISALYASPFYRHSTFFRNETAEQQREDMAARKKINDMSRRGRWGRGGRGSGGVPPWYVIVPIAVALFALKFWPRRKT